jgi:methionyl-tRNA synthetase
LSRTFYVTTAIDYVNSKPHLGTAYEKVTADCVARAHRLLGYDVLFVMGNDENSVKVEKSAREQGLEPQEFADRMEQEFRLAWQRLNISFDDFIRTTEPRHHTAVTELLRRVRENGYITRSRYTGWYCEGCEAFYTEKDLVDGKCPAHDTEPRWVEEENYFFRLSAFRDRLLEYIRAHHEFIRPEVRRNEIVAFLEAGLEDLSISRAGASWGIPFPDDPGHMVYVWFDALTNYISAAGFGTDEARFAKWWPADLHIIGKDITRFHCIIWPAMLMAAGVEPPRSVFGHGFIYHSGTKMSKSLGNIVNPLDVVDVTGADPLRYFLLREITYGKDGDFDWENFIDRYNADLANDLGNLVKRTTDMTAKFLGGEIPADPARAGDVTGLGEAVQRCVTNVTRAYESLDLSGALTEVWALVRQANRAVQEAKPWELAKDASRREELAGILSELLEAIRIIAVLAEPAIPEKVSLIRERLGLDAGTGELWSESARWRPGSAWRVAPGDPVFPRLDKGGVGTKEPAAAPAEAEIDLETFAKVRLVVATVLGAERVPGADRLLQLEVDIGSEKRHVVAGIAKEFAPPDLVGRQIVLVSNLKPAKIRGLESRGMILVAQAGGKMALLGPAEPVAPGAKVS